VLTAGIVVCIQLSMVAYVKPSMVIALPYGGGFIQVYLSMLSHLWLLLCPMVVVLYRCISMYMSKFIALPYGSDFIQFTGVYQCIASF
jgi:hypothetical protein